MYVLYIWLLLSYRMCKMSMVEIVHKLGLVPTDGKYIPADRLMTQWRVPPQGAFLLCRFAIGSNKIMAEMRQRIYLADCQWTPEV